MPHFEEPSMNNVAISSNSAPPAVEDISAITKTIYESKTSQESLDAAYALCDVLLNSVGFRGLNDYNVLQDVKKAAADKKNIGRREGAMFALGAIFERFPSKQRLSEVVFLLQHDYLLPMALDAIADKTPSVRDGAKYAIDALYKELGAEAKVYGLLPILIKYLRKGTAKWQSAVVAYELVGRMADDAKMGMESLEAEQAKDVLREAMGRKLEDLIPIVEGGMHDLKAEVSKAAIKSMNSLTTLLQNDDVQPRLPLLIKSMEDPSTQSLQKAIHALSQTTFVAIVTS
ncbi:ABC transporter domain-containing protein, partial [Aureobasidium melanogenum]